MDSLLQRFSNEKYEVRRVVWEVSLSYRRNMTGILKEDKRVEIWTLLSSNSNYVGPPRDRNGETDGDEGMQ